MPPACKREITPVTMHWQGQVGQPKYTASSNGRQLEPSPLPLLRLLVLNWASPGFLQSRELPCFLWLQSELSCLHRLGPSSSQYVLFLFRIHTDFLKGRFPETTTRSDLLETLAQIAFLWEGHSPLMAFYLHLSQRSAPQGLGSIHCYFYVLSTNQKAQHPSDTK